MRSKRTPAKVDNISMLTTPPNWKCAACGCEFTGDVSHVLKVTGGVTDRKASKVCVPCDAEPSISPGYVDVEVALRVALQDEVDRLTRELAQAKANESVAISYAGECKADLVRSESKLAEQRAIIAATRKVVVARLGDAGAGMDLVTDIDAALSRLAGHTD